MADAGKIPLPFWIPFAFGSIFFLITDDGNGPPKLSTLQEVSNNHPPRIRPFLNT